MKMSELGRRFWPRLLQRQRQRQRRPIFRRPRLNTETMSFLKLELSSCWQLSLPNNWLACYGNKSRAFLLFANLPTSTITKKEQFSLHGIGNVLFRRRKQMRLSRIFNIVTGIL